MEPSSMVCVFGCRCVTIIIDTVDILRHMAMAMDLMDELGFMQDIYSRQGYIANV